MGRCHLQLITVSGFTLLKLPGSEKKLNRFILLSIFYSAVNGIYHELDSVKCFIEKHEKPSPFLHEVFSEEQSLNNRWWGWGQTWAWFGHARVRDRVLRKEGRGPWRQERCSWTSLPPFNSTSDTQARKACVWPGICCVFSVSSCLILDA